MSIFPLKTIRIFLFETDLLPSMALIESSFLFFLNKKEEDHIPKPYHLVIKRSVFSIEFTFLG